MLAGTADGNPAVIAKPITWNANLVDHHIVLLNAIFATIQLLLGLGIAFRPTVQGRARRLGPVGAGRVVVRRRSGRGAQRGREPAQRRARAR